MKRMIIKLLVLSIGVLFFPGVVLMTVAPQFTHEYTASFIDKMNRLESINEPKIILVSNSNLAFGIESEIIEKELCMPVVNLGLHGGLGNAFHERMALINLNEGDIVVISHLEYADDDKISDPELALITVENYFKWWKVFRLKDLPREIFTLPKYSVKCIYRFLRRLDIEPAGNTCYARSKFNEYGDNVFPRNIEAGESKPELRHPKVNDICAKRLNQFNTICREKGAMLVISGAPIICGMQGFDKAEYIKFQNEVEARVECPVISDFTDYFYDKKFFYSSGLHLTNEGAVMRTRQLTHDLKEYLENIQY